MTASPLLLLTWPMIISVRRTTQVQVVNMFSRRQAKRTHFTTFGYKLLMSQSLILNSDLDIINTVRHSEGPVSREALILTLFHIKTANIKQLDKIVTMSEHF